MSIAWTIAGSDCSGAAGIQADLQTFRAFKVHGCSIITAVTAQNSQTITQIEYLSPQIIRAQINALHTDLSAKAIKIGMLANQQNLEIICEYLQSVQIPIVCDPVLYSSSGTPLLNRQAYSSFIKHLLPLSTIVTANIPEAEILLQQSLQSKNKIEQAAKQLLSLGAANVIIKGGHSNSEIVEDFFSDGKNSFWLGFPRDKHQNTRGTGCVFAAVITANLARNMSIYDAIIQAKSYVYQNIRSSKKINRANRITQQIFAKPFLRLPSVTTSLNKYSFPSCEKPGFYPIVDNKNDLQILLSLGVKTIQFRVKNLATEQLSAAIKEAITLGKKHHCQLFINDHWELAIRFGAYGVHLGQEDLKTASLKKIQDAGLRLGISTHQLFELAYALSLQPSYIAFGPIFSTDSKKMSIVAQGLKQLKRWRKLTTCHLVAIGGIKISDVKKIKQLGVDGIACISAIKISDFKTTCQNWLAHWNNSDE